MSFGVGHRRGLDPMLLWLWCRSAALPLNLPIAWDLPYAMSMALKKEKKRQKKERESENIETMDSFPVHVLSSQY